MPLRCPIGFVRLRPSGLRRGFTLVELLVAIAIIGALASIVVVAINPKKQLCDAENARRKVMVHEMTNALFQYIISTMDLPPDIPGSLATAKQICRAGVPTGPTCVNLDVLVQEYVAALPIDVAETDPTLTGYKVYTNAGRPMVIAAYYDETCSGIAAAGSTVAFRQRPSAIAAE